MNRIVTFSCLIVLVASFFSCAKIGSPKGGPKDMDPPVVIKTNPPENTVNAESQKKITLYFDEFIQLQDIFQEMILSPPLEDQIMAQIKGRNLVVDFPKEVEFDTTTYTLSFGTGIVDNNESNVLKNYTYVFSLKEYIDSMHIQGKVTSAFDFSADEERMFIMLYKNLNDSAPILEKPSYICRSDKEGNFLLQNIEEGKYRIFGLKDANGNLLFDLPNEQIAFSDSIIELTTDRFEKDALIQDSILLARVTNYDSISIDTTLSIVSDSITHRSDTSSMADSLVFEPNYYTYSTTLLFFTEKTYQQYMTDYTRPNKEKLVIMFNEPPVDTVEVSPINYTSTDKAWFLLDASEKGDTLNYWIVDTTLIALDSIFVEVCYTMHDSSMLAYSQVDTLLMRFTEEKQKQTRSKGGFFKRGEKTETEEAVKRPELSVGNNITNAREFPLYKYVKLESPSPIANIVEDSIKFFMYQDTLEIPLKFDIVRDSNSMYSFSLLKKLESDIRYRVFIRDSVVYDIYGETNDTIDFNFKTRAEDTYGILTMNFNNINKPSVIQLLDGKENVLREEQIRTNQRVRFEYLNAGDYTIKVFIDENENGIWDTGNYLKHIQPERVIYYPEIISVRTNWEVDLSWEIPE